ncbi:RidA family protein [Roseomonas marmotae]|uniref:RidA family protein n=1 Tax=Roseomonas marmotae TaxID=2768161 RepID=A0ABS3K9P7_9PROT|nr:RidA family protein [Roseomonas marmotae]MBO1074179.1 RidA family protein [Roseomonas marmotae]QTI78953.1 RidA family protein [Roseomonas marmotae]
MSRVTFSNPAGVPAPAGFYSQAALVEGPGRRLVIAGQIGVAADGTVAEGGPAQIRQALANLGAVLAAHGMGPKNVVRVLVLLTDRGLLGEWRQARNAFFGDHAPTSTLMVPAGLADERFLVEVEAEAVD